VQWTFLNSNLIDFIQAAEWHLGQFLQGQQIDSSGNRPFSSTLGASQFLQGFSCAKTDFDTQTVVFIVIFNLQNNIFI